MRSIVNAGAGVQIDPTAQIEGTLILGDHVSIGARVRIRMRGGILAVGAHSTIHEDVLIEGRDIQIGQEAWILPGAIIGGGSCFERSSSLNAGHFLHLGRDTFINTARAVVIGNEVGLGTRTAIFTHGAYLSALDGFPVSFAPVTIGARVWLPGAVVNPGVTIGSDTVVGVGSVVTRDIPAGSLAGGIPAKVLRGGAYPAPFAFGRFELWRDAFVRDYPDEAAVSDIRISPVHAATHGAIFDFQAKRISGPVTEASEGLRRQLRRYGIRFYSRPVAGQYRGWQ